MWWNPKAKRNMKFSKSDWSFTTVAILLLFLLSWLLYRDFTAGLDAGDREQVGVLTFKRRTAERKLSGSTLWQGMDASVAVYNLDSIRTSADSEATITLNDGTKIALEDNTMIVLNFVDDQAAVNFEYGSMQAQATGDKDLRVKSGDSEISLSDGDARISGQDNELELEVQKGEATVRKGDQEQQVRENEVAGLDGDDVRVEKNPLVLLSPGDQSRFFATGKRQTVAFTWQAQGAVTLQVASDRSFASIVAQGQQINGTQAAVGPGIYYWRIVQNGKSSPVRRFAVYEQQAPVLQMPLGGADFAYRDNPPLIQFLWSRLDGVSSYRIVVSQNRNLSSPVINEQLVVNSISRNLNPGTYYWQVQPLSSADGSVSPSGIGSFQVSRKEKLEAPIPLSPMNATFVQGAIQRDGLSFSWKQDPEIGTVSFQLSSDASFQSTVAAANVSGNVYRYQGELRPGTYYWRLTGAGFSSSRVARFQVADKERIDVVTPPAGETIASMREETSVRFAWKGGPGSYRLLVSRRADLSSPATAETTSRSSTINGLAPGNYYWKVQRFNSQGDLLGESNLTNLPSQIERKLDSPDLLFPVPGSNVDMTELDALTFRWRAVQGATLYNLKVYMLDGTGQRLILERSVRGTAFKLEDLSILDESLFRYSVEARAPGLEGKAADGAFRILLQLDKKPEFITPEVIFK
jgi:hypothetical protein